MKRSIIVANGILFSTLVFFAPPSQPVNPSPSNTGGSPLTNTPLCATVSDPDGGNLTVTYYGRPKVAPVATNQKFTVILLPDTQYYTAEPQGTNGGNQSFVYIPNILDSK